MKKILSLILILVCIFNFTPIVNAANNPATISVARTGTKYEFVDDLVIYEYKANGYHVYLLDSDTYFSSKITLEDPEEIYDGLHYIVNNANPSSNTNHNYYITQVAILWYQDYLNNNDNNINSNIKDYIENNVSNNSVCRYIVNLVEGAKNYNDIDEPIVFETDDVTFTKTNSNYISNQIKVTTNNLTSEPTIKFSNAPTNTTVSSKKLYKDGSGYFYIKIPINYYNNYNRDDFEVYLTGTSVDKQIFKYSDNGYNEVIFGKTYNNGNSSVKVSLPVSLNGNDINNDTNIIIKVLDENDNYIKNIKYSIYEGNCEYSTCDSSDLVRTFTTTSTYTTLKNILSEGTYTFVRKSTNSNYDLNEKEVIYVEDTESLQTFTFEENNQENDEVYKEFYIYNSINDSSNVIKIFKDNGTLVDSFRSNVTSYKIRLYEGIYYIKDTEGLVEVYFEINEEGELLVTEGNNKVSRNNIDLDNYLLRYTTDDESTNTNNNNSNNDNTEENIYTDKNGTIHIENLDGVNSIDISNDVKTTTDVTIEWISNIIDCPITSVSSTLKYIVGAIILALGIFLTYKNVKKHKNNI